MVDPPCDEPSSQRAVMPRSAAEYAAIEATLQKTPRGRWFLAEFARRNRTADTDLLLQAIAKLELAFERSGRDKPEPQVAGPDVRPAAEAASAAMAMPDLTQRLLGAADALAQMLEVSQEAQADILSAAEAVQDATWEMRERQLAGAHCAVIERRIADIHAASLLQSFAAQRTETVLELLRLIVQRLEAGPAPAGDAAPGGQVRPDAITLPPDGAVPQDEPAQPLDLDWMVRREASLEAQPPAGLPDPTPSRIAPEAVAPNGSGLPRQAAIPLAKGSAQPGKTSDAPRTEPRRAQILAGLDAARRAALFG
jgi:hypothetical protein